MKFFKRDLLQQANTPIHFEDEMEFDLSQFQNNHTSLRELHHVIVEGQITYDVNQDLAVVDYVVHGDMVVACSITNDDVKIGFEGHSSELYSFSKVDNLEDEIRVVKNDVIDLSESIFRTILFEVPLRVVKEGLTDYPKGDGWEVLSEEEFQKREKPIDPRLAKLLEFKVKE